ncbi:MAG: glycosyltransferase [Alphaproteobacteria bacterium]|nr:glycosyltransferase [Alphaproteobacteria bacterium]
MKTYGTPLAPRIEPLPQTTTRPLWSVMIPAYNYAHYMRGTLRSVLSQDPGPAEMQIEVVDDCSTRDDPEAVTHEVGGGRVGFYRQPRNLGIVGNFNDCIRRARGEWVHILHGDDLLRPGFYVRARQALAAHPEIGAWACRVIYMDDGGHWMGLSELETRRPQVLCQDFVERLFVDQRLYFVSLLVRRRIYEQLGGFRPELPLCLDWDMWKRIALATPIFYDPEPLACFRLHPVSAYANSVRSGESVADERRAIAIASAYVPSARAARLRRAALKAAAIRAVRTARQQWRLGYRAAALRVVREALRCSTAPGVLARLLASLPLALRRQMPPPAAEEARAPAELDMPPEVTA